MKKLYLFIASCFLASIAVNAANTNNRYNNQTPFIFIENGVEYAVFNNGEFDFNIIHQPKANINIRTRNINLSFNTGYNYEPYIQKDRYGAIVQIERTPIYYNRYGKVTRIGSVLINYNHHGWVSNIGNLNIYYTNHGTIYNRRGYINHHNINYKPCYFAYKRPNHRRSIVHTKPYRQNNFVREHYNYKAKEHKDNYKKKHKYSHKNNSSEKNKSKYYKKEFKKQTNNKKETYRGNSNSYRRTSSSNDSKYVTTNDNSSKKNKRR